MIESNTDTHFSHYVSIDHGPTPPVVPDSYNYDGVFVNLSYILRRSGGLCGAGALKQI